MTPDISVSEVFIFLFVMLGPLKVLGPYAKLTATADDNLRRQLAVRAFGISLVAVIVAGILGQVMLQKWNVSISAIALAAGLTLFVVAFKGILEQYTPGKQEPVPSQPPTIAAAVSPISFPMIVTPYGVATLITLLVLLPDLRLLILGLAVVVMVLNFLGMMFAHQIMRTFMLPLVIIGSVLGILQVALGIQIVIFGIRYLLAHP
jgi:multiple antibiotic resistance protein